MSGLAAVDSLFVELPESGLDFLVGDEDLNKSWRGNLHAGMLHQTLNATNRIAFHRIPSRNLTKKDLHPDNLPGGLDGVVLAIRENIQNWPRLKAGIPAVFDVPGGIDCTANFVAPDLLQAASEAGRAFASSGRRRPCLASHWDFDSAELGWLCAGPTAGYRKGKSGWNAIGTILFGATPEETSGLLRQIYSDPEKAPDALFCENDYTAIAILNNFHEMGIRVPNQVSVIGGTGLILMNTEYFAMTRVFQPLPDIGAELVKRLVAAIDEGDASPLRFPSVFLPYKFGGGQTTLPEENEVLGIPTTPRFVEITMKSGRK